MLVAPILQLLVLGEHESFVPAVYLTGFLFYFGEELNDHYVFPQLLTGHRLKSLTN
jgi:hypothetical protein